MTDDRNRYLSNDLKARTAFARQLEALAELVRSGEFEHVCIVWKRPDRPDATLIVTGPESHDYLGAIAGIEELGVRARVAQQRSSLTE